MAGCCSSPRIGSRAFDVVLPSIIADKGRVLTGLSRFWFAETAGIIANHLLDTSPEALAAAIGTADGSAGREAPDVGPLDDLRGRLMICRPASVVPIEAVVRGYLAGSGWKEYREHGTVCGIELPAGLRESDRLPEPIFTPATKAEAGAHDENIGFDRMIEHVAAMAARRGRRRCRRAGRGDPRPRVAAVWVRGGRRGAARDPARRHEVRVRAGRGAGSGGAAGPPTSRDEPADPRDRLILIDEALTPDSSRFWDAGSYAPGRPQASFDKQFVRDWLETQPWDKTAPGPALPDDVVAGTRARYVEAYERITGASFERYLREDVIGP